MTKNKERLVSIDAPNQDDYFDTVLSQDSDLCPDLVLTDDNLVIAPLEQHLEFLRVLARVMQVDLDQVYKRDADDYCCYYPKIINAVVEYAIALEETNLILPLVNAVFADNSPYANNTDVYFSHLRQYLP